jgi:acetylornithine aminotransferase
MVPGFSHCVYNDVSSLRSVFKKHSSTPLRHKLLGRKRRVAAVLLESLQGEGGIRPGDKDFFEEARRLCDEHGALLICDEVQVRVAGAERARALAVGEGLAPSPAEAGRISGCRGGG